MKLSVIIPVYNGEKYIRKTLQCVVEQTYKEIEIIVVDDSSNDNTLQVLDEFAKLDDRIVVLHTDAMKADLGLCSSRYAASEMKAGGVSVARNIGLKHATGDIVAFLDADDLILPNCYETMISAMEQTKSDVVAVAFKEFMTYEPSLEKLDWFDNSEQIIYEGNIEILRSMTGHDKTKSIRGYVWNKVYSRNLLEGIEFRENIRMCEDSLFSFQAMSRAERAVLLPVELHYYRIYDKSSTRNADAVVLLDAIYAYEELVELSKDIDRTVMENYINELLGWCMYVMSRIDKSSGQVYPILKRCLKKHYSYKIIESRGKRFAIESFAAKYSYYLYKLVCGILK